ncbi:hypothetical protein Esti_002471 [Eimeria stiedai]
MVRQETHLLNGMIPGGGGFVGRGKGRRCALEAPGSNHVSEGSGLFEASLTPSLVTRCHCCCPPDLRFCVRRVETEVRAVVPRSFSIRSSNADMKGSERAAHTLQGPPALCYHARSKEPQQGDLDEWPVSESWEICPFILSAFINTNTNASNTRILNYISEWRTICLRRAVSAAHNADCWTSSRYQRTSLLAFPACLNELKPSKMSDREAQTSHNSDEANGVIHETQGCGSPSPGSFEPTVEAVSHILNSSKVRSAYTPEQLAAAVAALDKWQSGSQKDSAEFELSLDQISCSLAPRLSLLGRLRCFFDWKSGRLKHPAPPPLEPVLHSLSAVIKAGKLVSALVPPSVEVAHSSRWHFVHVCCLTFAGSLVAIMGPSGCGKTTLLSIISGRSSMAYTGRVFLNGRPLERDFDRLSSYVSQEDVFDGNETVEECLRFSYRLRKATPRDWNSTERQQHEQEAIQRALNLLGLASVQHSRVGNSVRRGLSGGQKRRLTIGIGLMSDAKILLCDEPTSGLSAADAQLVVSALRRLSVECGVAVVAVIHQPSHAILQCFDHLLLMAHDGRCVYNSRVDTALEYFSALGFPCPVHQNPADFYLDLISQSGEHAQELADLYDQLMRPLVEAQVEAMQVAGAYTQCKEVASRSLRLWLRDHETLSAIFIDSLVQGLVIGGLFFNVRSRASVYYQLSALFLLVVSHLAASLWTIPLYVQQKAQYRAEVVDGYYAPIPFIFATCLVANMFVLLGNFVLVTSMWILFGFGFLPLVICLLVVAVGFVVCDVAGVICSLASSTFAEANAAATLLFFLLMFVNGFTSNPASLASGIGWISYFSPFFLVFEALAICILEPYNFATSPTDTSGHLPLRTKEEVYRTFGLAGRTYGYTGSAMHWVWSVDVVLLLVLMASAPFGCQW